MRVALFLMMLQAAGSGAEWKAGAEGELRTSHIHGAARVLLPEEWTPGQKWPALVYYAGTGGAADVETMRRHTGGCDFIIVGMPPRDDGAFRYTPESLQLEQAALGEVRDRLAAEADLDPARLYVAGFSKGGWMSGLLLAHTPWLAGGCVMGGGWIEHQHEPPGKFVRPVYIYVGDGRLDGNYPPSLRAGREFATLGARVTLDVWPETGHALPRGGAEGLRQWLALLGHGSRIEAEAAGWAVPELSRIRALPDHTERWTELRRFATRPFVHALGEEFRRLVAEEIAALERERAVAAEKALEAELDAITERETRDMKTTTLEAVGPRYEALAARAPGSRAGRLAVHDAERIRQLWKTVPGREPTGKAAAER